MSPAKISDDERNGLDETLGALRGQHGEGWINITNQERRLFAKLLEAEIARNDKPTELLASRASAAGADRHLGRVLMLLAEIPADEAPRALTSAMEYFNAANPTDIIEPTPGWVTHLVSVGPLDRAIAAGVSEYQVAGLARAMADAVGHGMTEKTERFARIAVEYFALSPAAQATKPKLADLLAGHEGRVTEAWLDAPLSTREGRAGAGQAAGVGDL